MLEPIQVISEAQHFFPHASNRRKNLLNNLRLAHYTSADVAKSIIENGEIWLRRATAMNDFQEIEYGRDVLVETFRNQATCNYRNLINSIFKGNHIDLLTEVERAYQDAREKTYICCFSEHRVEEDEIGRLSMWRAYGGETGVAIVIKPEPIKTKQPVGIISIPVTYPLRNNFIAEIDLQHRHVEENLSYFESLGYDTFCSVLRHALRLAVISTKHRGFQEELEWRAVFEPLTNPINHNKEIIASIRGTPQKVRIHKFTGTPADKERTLQIDEIIDRIIIGPTYHPDLMRDAFVSILEGINVKDAYKKVIKSDIPLRYF